MVLLAGPGPEGGGECCMSPQPQTPPRGAQVGDDPAEYEEYEDFSSLPDTRSIASDDSFYPPGDEEECGAVSSVSAQNVPEDDLEAATLLRAACANDVGLLRALVRRGPRVEEVQETDRNGRTGLIVACCHGFVDTVVALAECPHLDVNWQDSEGNTALITAAQAGHATITNYLLNYFPGLDLERRNVFGFTALMKAAMQGRTECVRALMLAGADVNARDPRRGMSPQEWAVFTGRAEAVRVMQRLLERPCAEQFGEKYKPELPLAPDAVLKPGGSKNCLQRLAQFLRATLTSRSGHSLEDGGVLDHMVRMTTSLYSPAVAIACQTVCPENAPCVGKRRLAVQRSWQLGTATAPMPRTGARSRAQSCNFRPPRRRPKEEPVSPRPTSRGSSAPPPPPARGRPASCPCSCCAGAACGPAWWSPGSASARRPRPPSSPSARPPRAAPRTAATCRSPSGGTRRPRRRRGRRRRRSGSAWRRRRRDGGRRPGGKGREGVKGRGWGGARAQAALRRPGIAMHLRWVTVTCRPTYTAPPGGSRSRSRAATGTAQPWFGWKRPREWRAAPADLPNTTSPNSGHLVSSLPKSPPF
uniref:Ankyrin repeat domain-containing protein 33B n=1 Tax=Castor canadensis TaxID=51338 RepID=A0A8C0X4Z4_CASCN